MSFITSFEPRDLWHHFDEILKIPRGSKNEERMRQYVIQVAESHGLTYKVDDAGNVVVRKPGSAGADRSPTVLQSHLDMVNEKNSDIEHDFETDPIIPQQDGDYLKATGTTLGSDNGIGVAAMLALAGSQDVSHGDLELLFTIDEETGLTGAAELATDMIEGRRLINLDSEEEGVLTIGCAGGADTTLTLQLLKEGVSAGESAIEVSLSGLKGGHSGVDIHLQRGNAVKLLVRALFSASRDTSFRVAELAGGNKHNAIPRESRATLVASEGSLTTLGAALEQELSAIRDEFRPAEPDLQFSIEAASLPGQTWDSTTTERVLALVDSLPHGVQTMSYDIPGLVETSTNLAAIPPQNGELTILMSSRSSVDSALKALRQKIRATASLAGAVAEEGEGYPGWKPDVGSPLLGVVKSVHQRVLGSEPEVGAIHAGLECGIIGEKYEGMDMISFGPQIEFPHSPDERVKISTVEDFYRLLCATLEELA